MEPNGESQLQTASFQFGQQMSTIGNRLLKLFNNMVKITDKAMDRVQQLGKSQYQEKEAYVQLKLHRNTFQNFSELPELGLTN